MASAMRLRAAGAGAGGGAGGGAMASSSGPAKPAVGLEAGTVLRAKVAVLGARAPDARRPPPGPPPRPPAGTRGGSRGRGRACAAETVPLLPSPGGAGAGAGGADGRAG